MRKNSLLYTAFGLTLALALAHFIAKTFYFYWTIWWFDNLTHLLAGFLGGLVAIWFLFDSNIFYKRAPTILGAISSAVVSVLIFAVAWEVFEYRNDIAQAIEGYTLDTSSDMFFAILGALLSGLFGSKNLSQREPNRLL